MNLLPDIRGRTTMQNSHILTQFEGEMRYNCSYPNMQTSGVLEAPTACSDQRKECFRMATSIIPEKRCSICGNSFPLTHEHFAKQRKARDGFCNACHSCRAKKRFLPIPPAINGTITITVSGRYETTIDEQDSDIAQYRWAYYLNGSNNAYAKRHTFVNETKQTFLLHRIILERKLGRTLNDNEVCDHRNGDTLDNRRENLRVASISQNTINSKRSSNNKSGYKGVSWNKSAGKWRATISIGGKPKILGEYKDIESAYRAYCEAAVKYHGEFANLGSHRDE